MSSSSTLMAAGMVPCIAAREEMVNNSHDGVGDATAARFLPFQPRY
ncbi:hypothetical protein ACUYLD_10040 [Paenibacillus sp. SER-28]